jgi:uncharacterized protein (DUF983 family)
MNAEPSRPSQKEIPHGGWSALKATCRRRTFYLDRIRRNEVARVLGIFLLGLNAVLQIVWFPAAPLWAFLMIVLDVVIIYQLTVNWTEQKG